WPATNPPSSTDTTSSSTAPSPAAATGPSSSRATSPCARRLIREPEIAGRDRMSAVSAFKQPEARPFHLAVIAGLACAFLIAKAAPLTGDIIAAVIEPLCMTSAQAADQNVVEPITSHALPNVPGKRVTVVRVFYGPGGSTPPHT